MATVSVHPIQREFTLTDGKQICRLCGAEERWTANAEPLIQGPALQRTLHLVHLVRAHLADVQATFSSGERKKEITVYDG
ncbi:MAG TPA: hypothetical protein VN327_15065 [Pseudonocardiaceae bacterium]|jgi:hypothetical protein|nr:hypothetical protein [Pseudonocardiaceae bacterium]